MPEDGDVVRIHYVGRRQDTGDIFDLTRSDVAEDEDMDTTELELGPVDVLIGAGHVIDGLEDALREMEAGEQRTVAVDAADAFGERDGDQIETVSRRDFDDHGVTPRRGLVVEIDGRQGKIVSTGSGRIRVDFNHPLAGKDLEYDVEILAEVEDRGEQVDAVLDYYGLDEADAAVDEGTVTVDLPDGATDALRDRLREELGMIEGVEDVAFRADEG